MSIWRTEWVRGSRGQLVRDACSPPHLAGAPEPPSSTHHPPPHLPLWLEPLAIRMGSSQAALPTEDEPTPARGRRSAWRATEEAPPNPPFWGFARLSTACSQGFPWAQPEKRNQSAQGRGPPNAGRDRGLWGPKLLQEAFVYLPGPLMALRTPGEPCVQSLRVPEGLPPPVLLA